MDLGTDFENIVHDTLIALALFTYIAIVVFFITKKLYNYMVSRGFKHNVAVYYNRKIIHMSAGGVVSLLIPIYFREPIIPLTFALLIAFLLYIPHRSGRILYWFQTVDNAYEVNFCIAWGISIAILWIALRNPYQAVVPSLMISFGDAVTGIVRNAIFGYRTKHWIGNVAMAATTIPIGYSYAGIPGAIAAIVSTIVERFEHNPIDDNILIALTSTAILLIFRFFSFS